MSDKSQDEKVGAAAAPVPAPPAKEAKDGEKEKAKKEDDKEEKKGEGKEKKEKKGRGKSKGKKGDRKKKEKSAEGGEKKERKARAPPKEKTPEQLKEYEEYAKRVPPVGADVAIIIEGKRERKQTKEFKFKPEDTRASKKAATVIEGAGEALGDIENVEKALKNLDAKHNAVVKLYTCMFPDAGKGTKLNRKRTMRKFSGWEKEKSAEHKKSAEEKLGKSKLDDLKTMCHILDVETSGTKEKLIERIVTFLVKPEASGHDYRPAVGGTKKRKASTSKTGKRSGSKKREKSDTPRTKNAFMLFSDDKRGAIRTKHPEYKITEVASKLGEMWRKMTDAQKETWTDRAEELREKAGGKKRSSSSKPAKKKRKVEKGSDDEGTASEHDDDEEKAAPKKRGKSADKKADKKRSPSRSPSKSKEKKGKEKKETKKSAGSEKKAKQKGKAKVDADGDTDMEPKKQASKQSKQSKQKSKDSVIEAKLRAAAADCVRGRNLNEITMGQVKKTLADKFGNEVVKGNKKFIRVVVHGLIS